MFWLWDASSAMFWRFFLLSLLVIVAVLAVVFKSQIAELSSAYQYQRDGNAALKLENWTAAQSIFEKARQEHPQRLDFTLALAQIYHHQKDAAQAEPLFLKVLKAEPQNLEARLDYAELLSEDWNRLNEAVEQYRKALKHHPADPAVLSALGRVYLHAASNPAERRESVQRWLYGQSAYYYRLALGQLPPEGKRFDTRFNLGMVYQKLEQPETAARYFCNALVEDGNRYEARYNLGLALISLGAYEEAFRQFRQAVQLLSDTDDVSQAQQLAERVQGVKNTVTSHNQPSRPVPESLHKGCLLVPTQENINTSGKD